MEMCQNHQSREATDTVPFLEHRICHPCANQYALAGFISIPICQSCRQGIAEPRNHKKGCPERRKVKL